MSSAFVVRRHSNELESKQALFGFQFEQIVWLVITAAGVGIIEQVWPNFFNYPYFSCSLPISDVLRFWPLLLYAAVMAILSSLDIGSSYLDEKLLGYGVGTSVLAGLWEEVGFRCFYICIGMIGVVVLNWMYSTFLGVVLGIFFAFVGFLFLKEKHILGGIACVVMVGFSFLVWSHTDPIYWFYSAIMFPILSFVSLGSLDSILSNSHNTLFVMGAIAANTRFRDCHKHQGLIGTLNAWVVGFVLLYVALTYGLMVAIAIHVIYDIEISLVRYGLRKYNS